MTESLIDIGSIISIIQMSEEIIKHAYYYFHTVCEAKNNILAIINLVSGFRKKTLQQLYSLFKFSEPQKFRPSHAWQKSLNIFIRICLVVTKMPPKENPYALYSAFHSIAHTLFNSIAAESKDFTDSYEVP